MVNTPSIRHNIEMLVSSMFVKLLFFCSPLVIQACHRQ